MTLIYIDDIIRQDSIPVYSNSLWRHLRERVDTMEEKKFQSTSQQIRILQERKLIIADEEKAIDILRRENYYNLVNGYKDVFLKTSEPDEYRDGTTFDELYALYLFDRELRNIFIKYILIIENNVKSNLAHVFSSKYGHKDYLKIQNFRSNQSIGREQSQFIGNLTELIADIQKEIAHQLKNNNTMISHYMLDFGYVPLWVLVNTLSLGTISKFYSYLKNEVQNEIAIKFGLKPDVLGSFLSVLTIFRNACAHNERFFSLKTKRSTYTEVGQTTTKKSIRQVSIHDKLEIPKGAGGHLHGKNDLLAVVIIFKCMLTPSDFECFFSQLKKQIDILGEKLHSITIEDVLKQMGFVDEHWNKWEEIKSIYNDSKS